MMKLKKVVCHLLLSIFIIGSLTSFFIPVENIQVRIFAHLKVVSFQMNVNRGTYKVMADGNVISDCSVGENYRFSLHGDSLDFYKNDVLTGVYKYIKFFRFFETNIYFN